MTGPVITETELQQELKRLDALRPKKPGRLLTDEQYRLIEHARTGARRVTWAKLAEWWNSHDWGHITQTALEKRYSIDRLRRRQE